MTYHEKIVVSAYTGYLMCDFSDMHKYIEDKLSRPVWTHEMAEEAMQKEIRKAVYSDFIALCGHKDKEHDVEVVRCKDCKHRFNYGICANRGDNWFCGYGERRADNG